MGYVGKCQHCGNVYEAERKSSRFCSTKCRVAFNRAEYPEGTIDREVYAILDALDAIGLLTDAELNNKRNKALMQRIFDKVENLKNRVDLQAES